MKGTFTSVMTSCRVQLWIFDAANQFYCTCCLREGSRSEMIAQVVQRLTLAMHEPLLSIFLLRNEWNEISDPSNGQRFFFSSIRSLLSIQKHSGDFFFCSSSTTTAFVYESFFFVIQTATADGRVNNFFPLSLFAVKLNNKSASLSSLRFAFFLPRRRRQRPIWNGPRRKSICNHNALHNVDVGKKGKKEKLQK